MGDEVHGMALIRRVVREHRRVVLPLAIALGVNIVLYAAVVYPLAQRVANIEQRDRTAERSEEHTSELQSHLNLVCRLLLEKKKKKKHRKDKKNIKFK